MALRTAPGPGLVDWAGDNLDSLGRTDTRTFAGGSTRLATDFYSVRITVFNGTATALVLGDLCRWDLSTSGFVAGKWVAGTTTTDDDVLACGVASEAIAAGTYGEMIIKGYVPVVKMKTGITIGQGLQASDTALSVEPTGSATERGLGVALSAEASNYGSAWLW